MRKNNFLLTAILTASFVFVLSGCNKTPDSQTQNQNQTGISGKPEVAQVSKNQTAEKDEAGLFKDWQTYKNAKYSYEIKYPKSWYFLEDGCCPPPPGYVTLNNYSGKKAKYAANQIKPEVFGFDITCMYEGKIDDIGEVQLMLKEGEESQRLKVNGMDAIRFIKNRIPGDETEKIYSYYIIKGAEGCRIIFTNQCDICADILSTFKSVE